MAMGSVSSRRMPCHPSSWSSRTSSRSPNTSFHQLAVFSASLTENEMCETSENLACTLPCLLWIGVKYDQNTPIRRNVKWLSSRPPRRTPSCACSRSGLDRIRTRATDGPQRGRHVASSRERGVRRAQAARSPRVRDRQADLHGEAGKHDLRHHREGSPGAASLAGAPGAGPVTEFEGLLKVAFADHGSIEGFRATSTQSETSPRPTSPTPSVGSRSTRDGRSVPRSPPGHRARRRAVPAAVRGPAPLGRLGGTGNKRVDRRDARHRRPSPRRRLPVAPELTPGRRIASLMSFEGPPCGANYTGVIWPPSPSGPGCDLRVPDSRGDVSRR